MARTTLTPRTRPDEQPRKLVVRKAFVKYLKFHRYRLGLTQDQLAHEIGISQGHYCEIERAGEESPSSHANDHRQPISGP